MDKVLADPNFKRYHAKYPQPKEDIPRDTYEGNGVYIPRESSSDSTDVDEIEDEDMNINETVADTL